MLRKDDMEKAQSRPAGPGRYVEHFCSGRFASNLGLIPKKYRSI